MDTGMTIEAIRRNTDAWLMQPKYAGIEVVHPDGWDRENLQTSWDELITEAEFLRRLSVSTCRFPADFVRQFMRKAS